MAVPPLHVDDGNFRVSDQIRDWEYDFPFASEGDGVSFIARRAMRVQSGYPGRSVLGERKTFPGRGYAYYCGLTPLRAVDAQSRLVDYDEIWASVPIRRVTHQTASYLEQLAYYWDEGQPQIVELPRSKNAKVVWEYALKPLNKLIAPRLAILNERLYAYAGWNNPKKGSEVLAEDSDNGLYMWPIYQRKSVYVIIETVKELLDPSA